MHACGHDVHMTIFVAVARYLAEHKDQWQGTVMFVGQPAEEHLLGARAMLEDGLYERFGRPDFALALHVASNLPAGIVGYANGFAAAASDSVDITVYGEGGHGASPHTANDPIIQAAQLVMALQTIVAREVNPLESAVVTVGAIQSGTAHNIIPGECELKLTVRSYKSEVRKLLLEAIERKATGIARSMGARKPRVKITRGTEALYNDPHLARRLDTVFRRRFGDERVVIDGPGMGSEDFAMFAQGGVPIFMFGLGSASRAQGQKSARLWPLHHPKYHPDVEPTLRTGITAMLNSVFELLPPR
jgi:hippurate hydrolase